MDKDVLSSYNKRTDYELTCTGTDVLLKYIVRKGNPCVEYLL